MAALQNQVIGYVANLPADLSDKRTQERLSPSAVKGFFEVVRLWKIRDESARELLGGVSNGTFYKLKKGQVSRLDVDKFPWSLGFSRRLTFCTARGWPTPG